jgi:hypothetical protein
MAHLWVRDSDDSWAAMQLDGRAVDVSVYPPRVLADGFRLGEDTLAAVVRAAAGVSPVWVLLVAAEGEARINGFAPVAGVRVLEDHDEIRAGASRALFFSTETLARVEDFPGSERAVYCGRCRQPMVKGQPAVRCPSPKCGIWYHQTESLPCWTYSPTCAFCPQPTPLDAAFAWVPEA